MAIAATSYFTLMLDEHERVHIAGSLHPKDKSIGVRPLNLPILVTQLTTSSNAAVFIDNGGYLWVLAISKKRPENDDTPSTQFFKLDEDPNYLSVSCNSHCISAINSKNEVIEFSANGKYKIQGLDNIKMIASGDEFTMYLSHSGFVYTKGVNFFGQLGVGDYLNRCEVTKIPKISNIVSIACGGQFTLFLNEDGDVFSTGWNYYGQLGLGDRKQRSTPEKIHGIPPIREISCTAYSSMMLDYSGVVWVCGYNYYGQLGTGDTKDRYSPCRVTNAKDIILMSKGGKHTILKSANEKVWVMGKNINSQLGFPQIVKYISSPTTSDQLSCRIGNPITFHGKSARV